MRWVKARCEGRTPLVMHALNSGEEVNGFCVIRDADPDREVNKNLWNGRPDGELSIPALYLGGRLQYAIRDAAASTGRPQKTDPALGDAYGIGSEDTLVILPRDGSSASWEPSTHRIPNGRSGMLILNLPLIGAWGFVLPLWYNETKVTQSALLETVQHLGEIGIGALSPHRGCGRNGRFRVTEWNEFTECPADMTPFMPKQTAEPAAAPVEA